MDVRELNAGVRRAVAVMAMLLCSRVAIAQTGENPAPTRPSTAEAPATPAAQEDPNETPTTTHTEMPSGTTERPEPPTTPPVAENPGQAPAPPARPPRAPVRYHSSSVRVPTFLPARRRGEPERMDLPHLAGAYFYRPARSGRQRVLVYLHSRGANPAEACRQWHESTPRFGWLVCPIGPADSPRGPGRREWRNNAEYARRESIAAIEALFAHFPRRVRRHDNVVIGFSEGAYVGMNVGLYEPVTFPRWLILAAHDGYIDGERERITRAASTVRRVYLLTGATDEIVDRTRRADELLRRAWGRRRVRMEILRGSGHQLPVDFVRVTRRALLWATQ